MVKKGLNDFILKPGAAAVRSRYESFANNSQNGRYPLQFSQETKNTVDGHLSQSEQCISTRRQFVVIGVLARRNASSQDHRAQYGHAYKSTKLLENGPDFSFLQTTHTFQNYHRTSSWNLAGRLASREAACATTTLAPDNSGTTQAKASGVSLFLHPFVAFHPCVGAIPSTVVSSTLELLLIILFSRQYWRPWRRCIHPTAER